MLSGRVFSKLSRSSYAAARLAEPSDLQELQVAASTERYDMVSAPDEPYYAEQYWRAITPHLASFPTGATVIDLGCSQGRISLRMAARFPDGQIVGCDLSTGAVAAAKANAERRSIHNAEFRVQPISECLQGLRDQSVDVVVMTEVAFFYPQWRDAIPQIVRCLRGGGVTAISFRPQYFYGMLAARGRHWQDVDAIHGARAGRILGNNSTFTWQTSGEIRELFTDEPTLELLELRGIGVCSGIPGDPHDTICRPSQLTETEREQLMVLEQELGRNIPDGGRYMLAIARKRTNP